MSFLVRIGFAIPLLTVGAIGVFAAVHESRPKGIEGAEADVLARKIQEAVGADQWKEIGAISFEFRGQRRILWDRLRDFARVEFDGKTVLLDVINRRGIAFVGSERVENDRQTAKLVDKAEAYFINDTFWVNPFASFFDHGVSRALVDDQLLVTYGSGGRTPGDAYLWRVRDDGIPVAWRMWVSIIPIGGLEVSWERWLELPGGARVATFHDSVMSLEISNVRAGKTLDDVEPGPDPFAAL
jgi:hypothetical protein